MKQDLDQAAADILLVSERDDRYHITRASLSRLADAPDLAWARSPAEAAWRLAGARCALVLVDAKVDEGRGRSLVRHLARHHPEAVMLTVCDTPADPARGLAACCDETWDGLGRALARWAATPGQAPPPERRPAPQRLQDDGPQPLDAGGRGRRWEHDHDARLRRLSTAVEQASEAICITDLDGCIEYVNQAACDSSGYTAGELIGRNAGVLKSGHTPAEDYRSLWQNLKSGQAWRGVLFNRRKDGRVYVETATITPVRDADGRIDGYLAVKEDVTEKRRLSDELDRYRQRLDEMVDQRTAELQRARAAAEAASTAKSAFLAAMSHEIRTPMNGVIGILDVLQRSSLSTYQKELTDTIVDSAAALLRVIDDILDFSKIEAGHLALECAPFELEHLVESTCDTLQPLAAARGVELRAFIDPGLPRQRHGDAYRLRQVLTNLLGNAVKFSAGQPRRGRVSLRVRPGRDGTIAFTVRDNGIGIEEEVRARLFQPFVQGVSSTMRSYGGTGLGLVISQRLTQAMGGCIVCQSRPGEGSLFQFELALQQGEAGADGAGGQAGAAGDSGDGSDPGATPARPLSGLRCLLLLADDELSADWAVYLRMAGAEVLPMRSWPAARDRALHDEAGAAGGAADASTVLVSTAQWLASAPGPLPPVVQVQSGQRRAPRRDGAGRVLLDIDGLHRGMLLKAVAMAAGRDPAPAPSGPAQDEPPRPAEDLETAALRGGVVLVAEDNQVNREVVLHQLRMLGLACEVVDDGVMAFERLRSAPQRYGVLLTDLHMPGLDGYELVAAIRALELAGQRRLPVVALTANAMRGEAEHCRSLGFDDFLCKPVRVAQLQQTLSRWLPAASAAPVQAAPAGAARIEELSPEFDDSVLVGLVGDDHARLARVRREYLRGIDKAGSELRAALACSDRATVAAVAHRLKSSSRAIGALALARLFEALEDAARRADSAALAALEARLAAALAAAQAHFRALT